MTIPVCLAQLTLGYWACYGEQRASFTRHISFTEVTSTLSSDPEQPSVIRSCKSTVYILLQSGMPVCLVASSPYIVPGVLKLAGLVVTEGLLDLTLLQISTETGQQPVPVL
jgi:hypothetical protein